MKHCPYCGTNYETSMHNCPSCGAVEAENKCASCGTVHNAKYCPNCGFGINDVLNQCPNCGKKTKENFCSNCGFNFIDKISAAVIYAPSQDEYEKVKSEWKTEKIKKTWVIVLLILFPPAGMLLMWLWMKGWDKITKALISVAITVWLFLLLAASPDNFPGDESGITDTRPTVTTDYNNGNENNSDSIGTRSNPAKLNQTVTFNGMAEIFDKYVVELTVTEVLRGEEAWDLVKSGNQFNSKPEEGKEYMLVRFNVKALESKKNKKIIINDAKFYFYNKSGVKYSNFVSIAGLSPRFSGMYPGGETEGYAYAIIDEGDEPLVVFLERYNQGIWFSTSE